MFKEEYFQELNELIKVGDFVLDSHNKIYSLILQGKNEDTSNIISYLESRCDDVESSKELINIKEQEILEFTDKDRVIKDYMQEVQSYKLKKKIEDLKKKQSILEKEGKFQETIEIAMELTRLTKSLKRGE